MSGTLYQLDPVGRPVSWDASLQPLVDGLRVQQLAARNQALQHANALDYWARADHGKRGQELRAAADFIRRQCVQGVAPLDDQALAQVISEQGDPPEDGTALHRWVLRLCQAVQGAVLRGPSLASASQATDAVVYPEDGTRSPFTVINLGHGMVQMGDCVHDRRLPALWFGREGKGMGHEEELHREARDGETIAVVTFANVEGLDVLLNVVQRIRRVAFPDAAAPAAKVQADDMREADAFFAEVRAELIRARAKFPGDRIMTLALAEEFGELCKAVLDESSAAVRKEAVQTAVMACRVAIDGDGSVDSWRRERGLDPLTCAALKDLPDERPTVRIGFSHDMEDGWYWLETPNGEEWTYRNFSKLLAESDARGWKRQWVGEERYNPEREESSNG